MLLVLRYGLWLVLCCASLAVLAKPEDGVVYRLKSSVVKVRVVLPNGSYGVGSGVVVAKDRVVTNCHVVNGAVAVNVIKFGDSYRASSVQADWKHDLCVVKFDGFDVPVAEMGSSAQLQYEQPVFSISFPNNAPKPITVYGHVKALYPMDSSVVVRSTSDFRMGASGGPLFDDAGKLVGIITLKSPGRNAFYYNMPVEWIASVLNQPELPIPSRGDLPFWDAPEEQRPFFMRVIGPYQNEDWSTLLEIASFWCKESPSSIEAMFYRGAALHGLQRWADAEAMFNNIIKLEPRHSEAYRYLGLMAAHHGNQAALDKVLATLAQLDEDTHLALLTAIGQAPAPAQ